MKKRADGLYQLSVLVGYTAMGAQRRKVVYGKTQKEVQSKASALRLQFNTGAVLDENITLGEWASAWLSVYKNGTEYNTQKMYMHIVNKYVLQLGHLPLVKVKTAHLQKVVNENATKGTTMKQFKLTLGQIFEQAIINDMLMKNPAKGLKLPAIAKKHNKRSLTDDEVERIKCLQLDERTRCFIFLLLYTGMRKSEVLALTKTDIDMEQMTITVSKSLVFMKNQSFVKDNPKTAAGVRSIPILEPLRPVLFAYMARVKGSLLFSATSGETVTMTSYRRMYEKFCTAMGTKEITAHIFRHNFATILYSAGVDIKAAQSILGHKSITVTMDIYTHLGTRQRDDATAKLNAFVAM
jgi:integrase